MLQGSFEFPSIREKNGQPFSRLGLALENPTVAQGEEIAKALEGEQGLFVLFLQKEDYGVLGGDGVEVPEPYAVPEPKKKGLFVGEAPSPQGAHVGVVGSRPKGLAIGEKIEASLAEAHLPFPIGRTQHLEQEPLREEGVFGKELLQHGKVRNLRLQEKRKNGSGFDFLLIDYDGGSV